MTGPWNRLRRASERPLFRTTSMTYLSPGRFWTDRRHRTWEITRTVPDRGRFRVYGRRVRP